MGTMLHHTGKGAWLSDCGLYRYELHRVWTDPQPRQPIMVWIMLNPSTADASRDDATIKRCMSFAKRENCAGMVVVNLFAFRATKPKHLRKALDPVGPFNEGAVCGQLHMAGALGRPVVVAWGAEPIACTRVPVLRRMAESEGVQLQCLGKTAEGHPRHPVRLSGTQPLEPWP